LGAAVGDAIEAVYVFRFARGNAESHLLGTTEHGRELASWLLWKGTARLHASGVRLLNLGGGVRPGDGIYRFKQRFNGLEKPLRAVRQIYDPALYEALCHEAGASTSTAYFPAYRERDQGALAPDRMP